MDFFKENHSFFKQKKRGNGKVLKQQGTSVKVENLIQGTETKSSTL